MAGFAGEAFAPDAFLLEGPASGSNGEIFPTVAVVAPPDVTAPVISNISPTPGTPIARTQVITFEITDNSGLFRRILPAVLFPGLEALEIIHDGEAFTGLYENNSTRAAIANGYIYSVLRKNGWPDAPTLIPFAFDQGGNEPT